jgi:prepilin signal peptidase PulO-like enzyme (type II secretory pathway)
VCSGDGFCYQCLPDYSHEPNCQYQSSLPPTLMIYILAPIAVLTLLSIVAAAAKCGGADSVLSQTIFSFSFLELLAWVLTVPIMPNVMSSMVLLSFLALRMIISIVSYEVFYRHNLGELSQKLLEEESIKGSQKS